MVLSIITPVYNGAEFIRRNIESIVALNVEHEHVIVDGGSTDGTLDIIKEYPNVKLIHQKENTGMYGAIIQGFKLAQGKYITWINCDDYILPVDYHMMVMKLIDSDADLIYSDSFMDYRKEGIMCVNKSAKALPKYFIKHGILPFIQPSSIYKKDFYYRSGGLNQYYRITGDMIMFYHMAYDKNAKFVRFNGKTVAFLKYGESLGDKNGQKGRKELKEAGVPKPDLFARILFKLLRMF